MMKNLVELLHKKYVEHPNRVCFYDSDSSIWTYAKLYTFSVKIASFLKEKGIEEHTNIGIYFNNNASFVASFFGVLMANCVAVPLPYLSKQDELAAIFKGADRSICLLSEKENPVPNVMNCPISYERLVNHQESYEPFLNHEPNCLAVLFPTSGSTGQSKLVMLTHHNMLSNAIAHGKAVALSQEDNFLISMPLYFSSALTTQIIACLYFESIIFFNSLPFIPQRLVKKMKDQQVTATALTPTSLQMVVTQMSKKEQINFTLRTVVVSGSNLDDGTYATARKAFPNAAILQTYGLTEGSPRVSIMGRDDSALTCGRTVEDVEIRIVHDDGTSCEVNEIGEVLVKGPNMMLGYYKNQHLTKETIRDGWLYTGDLGFIDQEENLTIVGRKKNIIIVGGINVYPEEVEEEILNTFPEIKEVAITSERDPLYGEVPVAIIVYHEGEKLASKERDIRLSSKLSDYKIPKV